MNPNLEIARGAADTRCCSADIPVCGFTGLSSPVFPIGNWRLESRQNPQAGKPALRSQRNSTLDFGLEQTQLAAQDTLKYPRDQNPEHQPRTNLI